MRRGVAILNAMFVGLILGALGIALLGQLAHHYRLHRQRQFGIQAAWNSRAGIEHFLATGQLPPVDPTTGLRTIFLNGPGDRSRCCDVRRQGDDLIFRGVAQAESRAIVLVGSDPNQRREEP